MIGPETHYLKDPSRAFIPLGNTRHGQTTCLPWTRTSLYQAEYIGNRIKGQWRASRATSPGEMWRKAFSPSTLTVAVVVVVVVVMVTGSAANNHTSSCMSDLTQEIAMSLVVNQLAILKGMNESSSLCASRDRDYHLWKEEANQQLQAAEDSLRGMAEDAQAHMHNMLEETRDSLRGMAEDTQSRMQAMGEAVQAQQQAVEARQQEVKEGVQAQHRAVEELQQAVEDAVQAKQLGVEAAEARQQAVEAKQRAVEVRQREVEEAVQAQKQAVEEQMQTTEEAVQAQQRSVEAALAELQNSYNISLQVGMEALHNDTEPSRCDPTGDTKVLHGARGTLYSVLLQDCWWRVVLPAGTRPFFHWEFSEGDCRGCLCAGMTVYEVRDGGEEHLAAGLCYETILDPHPVNRLTSNEFIVKFWKRNREGAMSVHYQAVPIN